VGTFNNRQQPKTYQVVQEFSGTAPTVCTAATIVGSTSETPIMDFSYNFVDSSGHNNGNVQNISNNIDWTRTQSFTYDSLNRISTAQTGADNQPAFSGDTGSILACWAETYTYDPWGNLTSLGPNSTTQPNYVGCTQESGFNYTGAGQITTKNQIAAYCYDAAGNLVLETTCPTGTFTPAFQYDAENHLVSTASVNYTYDGDGKRVMKSNGTIYWYGTSPSAIIESDLSANLRYEYFFFNGQRVGRTSNSVTWYFADHLGSSRVVWSTAANDNSDFYPFGGERVISSGTANSYKFTAKERDSESGLDNFGARYNASTMGRFMSPDPANFGAVDEYPQTWNAYSYVTNNPLNAIDPNGLDCIYAGTASDNPDPGGAGTVTVVRGDCINAGGKNDSGTFVDGTVDTNKPITSDAATGDLTFGLTNDKGAYGTGIATNFSNPQSPGSSDQLNPFALGVFTQLNKMNITNNTLKLYGASALIGLTGGTACYYICSAAGATTLAGGAAQAASALPGQLSTLIELTVSGKAAQAYAICVALAASPEGQALLRSLNQAVTQVIVQYGSQVPQEYFAALQTVQEMTGKFLN
jgi:RHS repeat-associated protein